MKDTKVLFCTSADNNFIDGCATMIYSLRKNLQDFESNDLKVYYTNLSDAGKEKIRFAAGPECNLTFVKPDNMDYCDGATTIYGKENKDVYLCLESFNQPEYDTVVCFDSDMLCINPFDYHVVARNQADFAAVRTIQAGHHRPLSTDGHKKVGQDPKFTNFTEKINGGFWIIGKEWLTGKVYKNLREIVVKETRGISGADQETVNRYCRRKCSKSNFMMLPDGYNFKNWGGVVEDFKKNIGRGGDNLFQLCIDDIKIVHFSGRRKPWATHIKSSDPDDFCSITDLEGMNRSTAAKMWHEYYEECFGEKCHSSIMVKSK